MNASGDFEAAVTARTRIGWMIFREYYMEKEFVEVKGKNLSELCEICDTVWK